MDDKKSKKDNPYSDDVRPSFLSDREDKRKKEKGGFFGFGSRKERSSSAADDLSDSEESALDEDEFGREDGIAGARQSEEKAGGFYSGGNRRKGVGKKSQSKFNILKRGGPTFGIFGVIAGMGGFMYGAQSLMPVAIEEMIIEKFNSIGISSTMASDAWLNTQLNIGVRQGKLTNASGNSRNNTGNSANNNVNNMDYSNRVTYQLGEPFWTTDRASGRFLQGATITEDHYVFAEISRGNENGIIAFVDRKPPYNRYEISMGSGSHLNTMHYDYERKLVWLQTGDAERTGSGIGGICFDPYMHAEVSCGEGDYAVYGPRGYRTPGGDVVNAGQGRDAVNNVGFMAATTHGCALEGKYDECNVSYIAICPSTSECGEHQLLTITGYERQELEDIAFDSEGMILIFNKFDAGKNENAYYRISNSFMQDNFGVNVNPSGGGSVIYSDGSTGGSYFGSVNVSNSSSGDTGINDGAWGNYKEVYLTLGGTDAPLVWEVGRNASRYAQGSAVTEDYYIYVEAGPVEPGQGHTNPVLMIWDRSSGELLKTISLPNGDYNSMHYDYAHRQLWIQSFSGTDSSTGVRGQCFDVAVFNFVDCQTYGPNRNNKSSLGSNPGDQFAGQGREVVNNVEFVSLWKQDTNDQAIISICEAVSNCDQSHNIILNGFSSGEIQDVAIDANGDLYVIFDMWNGGNRRVSYYKISRQYLYDTFGINTVPNGDGSVIYDDGSTGGSYASENSYSDVTIIGDSISTDAANGVNGNMRDLFAEYLTGADYGDQHVEQQVVRFYNGTPYGILQYGKSFKTEKSNNPSGLSIINMMNNNGELRNYVLFLLGTNDNSATSGWLTDEDIDSLMNAIGPTRKVVLMTDYVHSSRGWDFNGDGKNNAVIRNALERYPGRIAIADWGAIANDNDIRDNGDGVKNFHFTESGGEKFVQEVKRALDSIRPVQSGQAGTGGRMRASSIAANLFAFSEFQVEQFEKQGIKVVTGINVGSNSITALLYKKGVRYVPVVGSDYIGSDGLVDAIMMASGMSNIGNPVTASMALADKDFKIPYTTASKAWRGGVSGWFDNIMTTLTETKLSLNRNRWAKYIAGEIKGLNEQFMKIAADYDLKTGKSLDDGVDVDIDTDDERQAVLDVEVEGSNEKINVGDDIVSAAKASSSTSFAEGLSNVLNSKAVKAASAISEYACALTEGLISIYTVVSAYQNLQFLNLVSGFLESVDKVKAGDGASSPVDDYANNLTTPGTTVDDNGNTIPRKGTALMSAGMAFLFSGSPISQDDDSVRSVNLETIMANSSRFLKDVERTVRFNEACGWIRAGTAAVDLVATIVSFIPYVGQAVKVVQVSAKVIAKAAIKTAVQIALHALIPVIVKKVTKTLISNAATEWFGEDLGNALVSGAGKYLGGNGTSGGQSPGSKEKVLGYLRERDTVIAEEAEYQRAIRSPFDLTSKYTFLGSLYYSLIPLAYSGNGFMKSLTASSSIMNSSLVALSPTASAIGKEEVNASSGDCGVLGMAHAVGDAFCNPYIITDTSTMDYSPIAVYNLVHDMRSDDAIAANSSYRGISSANFNSDGSIVEGSSLHRYIVYCGERTSQYGIKDASIYESIMGKNSLVTNVAGAIPILGDVIDIGSGVKEEVNAQWINGSACVATGDSEENDKWESEYKYYQRYTENMRLVENMNPGYKSDVTALIEEHYKENPLDQSFEGTLARFSGMSKQQVEDTLALMEYYEFLDEYEPSERYAFVKPAESKPLLFDNDNKLAKTYYVLLNQISYSDVRNRTFAV